jgi:hypothetical protein
MLCVTKSLTDVSVPALPAPKMRCSQGLLGSAIKACTRRM